MDKPIRAPFYQIVVLALLLALEAYAADVTVIENVRLFDGEVVHDRMTVVLTGGHIEAVVDSPSEVVVPDGAAIVDGAGHTLLPGLIDAHTHNFSRAALARALDFGVTTSIDMGTTNPASHTVFREEQQGGAVHDRSDIVSAGLGITAPGGHGTQFGVEIPTLGEGEDPAAFVAARIAEGSEFIKFIKDDFSVVGFDIPTLSDEQVEAVVSASHERQRLAVVHARDLEGYLASMSAGVDGFVHALSEELPSDELLELMSRKHPFVIPTLTTTEGTQGGDGGTRFAADETMSLLLTEREKQNLRRKRFSEPRKEFDFSIALRSVGMMHANGTLIVAGSDAPNPGTTTGASIHRELELLVEAGLTPVEAIRAATANAADAFALSDRGRIIPGHRADLLMVEGDPTKTITDTRKIRAIWKVGQAHHVMPPQ